MPDTTFEPFTVHGVPNAFRVDRARSAGAVATRPGFDTGGRAAVPDVLVAEARDRARAEGFAAGHAEGRAVAEAATRADREAAARARETALEQGHAEVAAAVDALRRCATAWETRRDTVAAELVDHVVEGIAALAEAVLGHALQRGEDTALDAVTRALTPVPGTGPVLVALAPDDARVLHGAAHLLEATTTLGGREVTLVADPALSRGDATATSGASRVEVRLAEAVARAVTALAS